MPLWSVCLSVCVHKNPIIGDQRQDRCVSNDTYGDVSPLFQPKASRIGVTSHAGRWSSVEHNGRASKTHVRQLLVEDRNVGALSSWSTEVPLQEAVVTVTSVTGWAQWRHLAQCTPSHDNGVCAMSSGVGRWKNVLSPMLLLSILHDERFPSSFTRLCRLNTEQLDALCANAGAILRQLLPKTRHLCEILLLSVRPHL